MSGGCSGDDGGTAGDNSISGGNGGSGNNGGSANGGSGNDGGSSNGGNGFGGFIDSGTNGGSGGTGIDPDAGCAFDKVTGDRVPANMLFVIDRSGSMNCNPPPTQTSAQCENSPQKQDQSLNSKWEDTRIALEAALDQLQAQPNVGVGVNMFPRDNSCQVSGTPNIQVTSLDSTQLSGIKAFFGTVDPGGRTPLAGATILSYKHLLTQLQAGNLEGNKFVVLITDGFETCAPDELNKLVNTDVPNAYDLLNIRTFVIGAPGSEGARSLLSQIAKAGGTASSPTCTADPNGNADVGDCHFDLTNVSSPQDFANQLSQALEAISGTVLTCEFDVPQASGGGEVDRDKVNVIVTPDGGTAVNLQQDNADCENSANGWQYNADKTKIVLCGNACDTAKQEGSSVQIVLGCPSDIK
ncbi:MAG: VWA domain-containing protein [Polyangiaceae bacterium]